MAELAATQIAAQAAEPMVRTIGVADLRVALSAGLDDFLAAPTQLVFLCILYPIVGLVAARATIGTDLLPLLFPLVAGISLLGPVLAVGTYEISRRREKGEPVSWLSAFSVVRSPAMPAITMIGIGLLAIFTLWIGAAKLLYSLTIGTDAPASAGDFARTLLDTAAGWGLMLFGDLVGLVFAIAVLSLTVVSVPLLLDRNVSPMTAIRTSLRAVALNPATLAIWGLIVAAGLLLGCIPLFIGLAVAMPVLGHSTWHLYRRLIA